MILQEASSGIVRVIYSDKAGNIKSLTRQTNTKTGKSPKSSRLRRPNKTAAKLVRKKKRKPKEIVEAVVVPEVDVVGEDVVYDYVDYVYDYDDYEAGPVGGNGKS